jgi:hypothetical protein
MGAFGTYKIAMDHPEAFEAAVTIVGNATGAETGLDRLTNLRWMPLYARHGTADELVPITTEIDTQNALNALGLRHVYDFQPAEDHIVVALKDAYDDIAEFMAGIDKLDPVATPAKISFGLTPQAKAENRAFEGDHKINRPGAWWLEGVAARSAEQKSRIEATSHKLPNPTYDIVARDEPRLLGSPTPTLRHVLEWGAPHDDPHAGPTLVATLTIVGALTLDLPDAGHGSGTATITITTDGAISLRFAGLDGRSVNGQQLSNGALVLDQGTHVLEIACLRRCSAHRRPR